MSTTVEPLPHLRFEIPEAARILRISRATLYERIREGLITTQKDGRRTFITRAARLVHKVGGSLRDVQLLAGHRSIQTTQRYIDGDSDAQRKLVSMI